ncbi:TIGR04283 family arsenosugar biosynthesis glycosyltransferase [Modicisalibacter luteus]|uniref:TIGR04283 family arsenosugar biosynthesis glycosyltransferase n=1 Tax=Modicisalibacter luteus TaxID=453962 RepID=A0ABV7LZA0_9GAMM|nr:TIGR04283 family arsenosugar biosynthesis glycosyltransferase [Halomonas lutea]GHA96562.1 glycosyl transferase family 2 [Halomonas lutea]
MNVPTLSIIIPTLNEAAAIESQLSSLLGLWVCGCEIIVVDGGSTDETRRLAAPYASLVITSRPGRAAQMNAGARASRSERLLFLHADTRLPRRADKRVLAALVDGHVWGRFDIRLEGHSPWLSMVSLGMNLRSRLTGIATGDQALFMTRDAFETVGGFPEQPLMEDIELCRRLNRLSPPVCLRERVVSSGRRWEAQGTWRTIFQMWRLRYRYWRGVDSRTLAEEYHDVR